QRAIDFIAGTVPDESHSPACSYKRGAHPVDLNAVLPPVIANELLLTGRRMTAEGARGWGLVNRVTPAADLTDEALALARDICAGAPLAAAAVKEITRATAAMSLEQGYATLRGGGLPVYQAMLTSADAAEGPRAFAERRSPRWTGR
ncbi:MAG: hypothetical protein GEV04_25725, partial [Actinophytocola sp.]|nr:hypothetical protein [Actinophytocola sp.]